MCDESEDRRLWRDRQSAGVKTRRLPCLFFGPAKAVPLLQNPNCQIRQTLSKASEFAGRFGTAEAVPFQIIIFCSRREIAPPVRVHFPMQKVEKMRLRMSSGVVWPVRESRDQRAR
jgi:hypothetical protein